MQSISRLIKITCVHCLIKLNLSELYVLVMSDKHLRCCQSLLKWGKFFLKTFVSSHFTGGGGEKIVSSGRMLSGGKFSLSDTKGNSFGLP
ncbi:CLUMA_CG014582, isoform A [Clunio marinus]|uniref:CLUMA_CG014582, isoform A n=1 Tax=Clunio marinus TaxID=568069 RepID=A0A1J1IPV2_9DIPT|nr:CLUMA_CG014582, isoform A [Clunio marinus]